MSRHLLFKPTVLLSVNYKGAGIGLGRGMDFSASGTRGLFVPSKLKPNIPKELGFGEQSCPRRQVHKRAGAGLKVDLLNDISKIENHKGKIQPVYEREAYDILEYTGGVTEKLYFSSVLVESTNVSVLMSFLREGFCEAVYRVSFLEGDKSIAAPVYKDKNRRLNVFEKTIALCEGAKKAVDKLLKEGRLDLPRILIFLHASPSDKSNVDAIDAFNKVFHLKDGKPPKQSG